MKEADKKFQSLTHWCNNVLVLDFFFAIIIFMAITVIFSQTIMTRLLFQKLSVGGFASLYRPPDELPTDLQSLKSEFCSCCKFTLRCYSLCVFFCAKTKKKYGCSVNLMNF